MAVVGVRTWRMRGRPRARRIGLVALVTVLAVLVAGVAVLALRVDRAGSGGSSYSSRPSAPLPAGAPDGGSAAERAGATSRADDSTVATPAPGSPPLPPDVPVGPPGSGQRFLIRTAQLTLEVDSPSTATRQVRTTAAAVGGVLVEEQTTDTGSYLVLRVPADTLDRVIDDVAALGTVTDRSSQVEDSTGEIVDLDARVASQRASVERVRTLLTQAESIGDVVAIESELARREADLDALTSRLAVLRDQVALSTLTLDLRGPSATVVPEDGPEGFEEGLSAGLEGLAALGTATGAVIGFLVPFLPVLAVLFGLLWAARRVLRGRRTVAPAPAAGPPPAGTPTGP